MAKQYNHFKIGVFMIIAIMILVIMLLGLGTGHFFQKKRYMETFFDESVQGLQIGSNVKYLGIDIGRVEQIKLLDRVYPQLAKSDEASRLIYAKITITANNYATDSFISSLEAQVKMGLRAQLQPQGLTGASDLNLTFVSPAANPILKIPGLRKHRFPYIPSATSTITRFTDALNNLFSKVKHSDILPLLRNTNQLTVTAEQAIKDANMPGVSKDTRNTLYAIATAANQYKQVANHIIALLNKKQVGDTVDNIAEVTKTLEKTTQLANQTLSSLKVTIHNSNQILMGFKVDEETLMKNIQESSGNIKTITNNAKEYPSQLIFSKPPPHLDPSQL